MDGGIGDTLEAHSLRVKLSNLQLYHGFKSHDTQHIRHIVTHGFYWVGVHNLF